MNIYTTKAILASSLPWLMENFKIDHNQQKCLAFEGRNNSHRDILFLNTEWLTRDKCILLCALAAKLCGIIQLTSRRNTLCTAISGIANLMSLRKMLPCVSSPWGPTFLRTVTKLLMIAAIEQMLSDTHKPLFRVWFIIIFISLFHNGIFSDQTVF